MSRGCRPMRNGVIRLVIEAVRCRDGFAPFRPGPGPVFSQAGRLWAGGGVSHQAPGQSRFPKFFKFVHQKGLVIFFFSVAQSGRKIQQLGPPSKPADTRKSLSGRTDCHLPLQSDGGREF